MLEVEPKSPERSDGRERGGGREDGERESKGGGGQQCHNFATSMLQL